MGLTREEIVWFNEIVSEGLKEAKKKRAISSDTRKSLDHVLIATCPDSPHSERGRINERRPDIWQGPNEDQEQVEEKKQGQDDEDREENETQWQIEAQWQGEKQWWAEYYLRRVEQNRKSPSSPLK
jgi:hypothetical protein